MSKTTGFPGTNASSGFPWVANESVPQAELGQRIYGDDGSEYVYVLAGAAALVVGSLYQERAEDTGDQALAVAATAIGSYTITTTSTVTVTANQYQGGYVVVSVTPGLANKYRIASHPAATAAAVTLTLEDPILVALTTSSRIDLTPNPYSGVIVQSVSGSLTGRPAGFAVAPVSANQYGWLQTWGPGAVLNDANAAITVGQDLIPSATVAGAVRLATAGIPSVAVARTGIAASEVGSAFIRVG